MFMAMAPPLDCSVYRIQRGLHEISDDYQKDST
jgi:hypothetical protein